MDVFHLLPNQGARGLKFFLWDFEDQLIVDLKGHTGLQALFPQSGIDPDHRDLDQVSGRALQWSVYRSAFGEPALIGIFAIDIRDWPDPSEKSCNFLIAAGLFQSVVDERAHAFVLFKIGVDELLGFSGLDPKSLREAGCRESIDNSEVHDLGLAAMISGNH